MGSKKKKKEEKRRLKQAQKAKIQSKKSKPHFGKNKLIAIISIILLTCISFSTSLNNGFVNWDDDRNFYENDNITTLTKDNFWENTVSIFTSDVIGGYNPLTIWTFLIEQKLFGLDQPFYWHLNNLLLHLICTFFVFLILNRLNIGFWGTVIGTALFAIHPMRVESVAWVTERKDVLFGAFYLAALFYYIKGKQEGFSKKKYAIITICFLLSLLSKIQAVILPISFILVDYYLSDESQIKIKSIINKIPFFIMSLAIGLLGIKFLSDEGSTEQVYTGITRIFIGAYSLMTYYVKSIVPFKLSPLYPYPSTIDWTFYASIFSFIATGLILWWSYKKKKKVIFFGLGFFIVNVVLLLQVFGAGQGFLADRFTYIPYLGLFMIFGYYIQKFTDNNKKFSKPILAASAFVLLGFSIITYNQNKIWKDSGTLWSHVLKYYSKSTLPWGNRANFYRDNNQTAKALYDYGQVIKLKPDKPEPYNSRARLYFNFNQRDSLLKALNNYNQAIELKPTDVEYRVNRGATYAKLGNLNKAMENLNDAEKIDASFANIYLNRSVIHNMKQDWNSALSDINKYISYKPYNSDMHYEKGRIHNILGQNQLGIESINKAIGIKQRGLYYFERAKSYYGLQNFSQAKSDIAQSQRLGYKGAQNVIDAIQNAQ